MWLAKSLAYWCPFIRKGKIRYHWATYAEGSSLTTELETEIETADFGRNVGLFPPGKTGRRCSENIGDTLFGWWMYNLLSADLERCYVCQQDFPLYTTTQTAFVVDITVTLSITLGLSLIGHLDFDDRQKVNKQARGKSMAVSFTWWWLA